MWYRDTDSSSEQIDVANILKEYREARLPPTVSSNDLGEASTSSTPLFAPNQLQLRVFDNTLLNENDALLRRKRRTASSDDEPTPKAASTCDSPWSVRYMQSELIHLKAENSSLSSQLRNLKSVQRATDSLHEEEVNSLKQIIARDKKSMNDLEQRIASLKSREEALKAELSGLKSLYSNDRIKTDNDCQELLDNLTCLSDKFQEVNSQKTFLEIALEDSKCQLSSLQLNYEEASIRCDVLAHEVEKLRKSLLDKNHMENEFLSTKRKIAELEADRESCAENMKQVKNYEKQFCRLVDLERQVKELSSSNNRLRQMTTSTIKLEAIVEEQKRQLEVASDKDSKIVNLGIEVGKLKARLRDFENLVSNVLGSNDKAAIHLERYIQEIHSKHLLAVSESSEREIRLKREESEHEACKSKCSLLTEELRKVSRQLEDANNMIKRFKKQCAFLQRERNDLRNLVDSCQKEVSMTNNATSQRETFLEKMVSNYKQRVKDLENELLSLRMAGELYDSNLTSLKNEKEALKTQLAKYKYELDHRALKGDFNVQNTKIVHIRNNPAEIGYRQQAGENELIRKENAALRSRIRLLQEGHTADITQIIMEKQDNPNEILELKLRVKSVELQNQRLKEAFKQTGHEFREAINMLLGYKVDALPSKVYKLTNLYAESPGDFLSFKMSKGGMMEMLETNYSRTLTEFIDKNLNHHQSIPLFLASVTVDLFHRQTASHA